MAEVTFEKGLNVIVGPSDTGKTFIAQCIDFMFGGSTAPKAIPEAEGYDTASLTIELYRDGGQYVLERSLRGGDFRLCFGEGEEELLEAKHAAERKNTVSYFLLNASGLAEKKVRTNQQGKTRPLSFRDIAKLILIDETDIITERSPIHTGQYTARTAEQNVFRLLLTGIDDSSVVAKLDPKISKGKVEGQTEILDRLIRVTRDRLSAMGHGGPEEIRAELDRIQSSNREASLLLADEQKSVAELDRRRNVEWSESRKIQSRIAVLSELQERFELLVRQYGSDLSRLDAIAEVGLRLGQMGEERCPVCGAVSEYHDAAHTSPFASPEEVELASRAEAAKIRALQEDLRKTIEDNAAELSVLNEARKTRQDNLTLINNEIANRVRPRLQEALSQFNETNGLRDTLLTALELHAQLEQLHQLQSSVGTVAGKSSIDGLKGPVGTDEAEDFSQEVERLLRSWKFPGLDRVTFSEEEQDVVISGRKRSTHGKGVRAITHSAFNLALLQYCVDQSKPHPGLVIIDSPLVVYREPDKDEGDFSNAVKDAFYLSIAKDFSDLQVILFENDPPPAVAEFSANIITFSGNSFGRKGFIPKPTEINP